MAAATANREITRQPGELVAYNGASGRHYYAGTMVIRNNAGAIVPGALGASGDLISFLGVVQDNVNLTTNNGNSNLSLNVYKTGEFTFVAQGNGVSADIGRIAYLMDDQTVGVSTGIPRTPVGEITGIPNSTSYRVRITNYTGTLSLNV